MNLGKFIVIEGLEGAGKSSVIFRVKQLLDHQGVKSIHTREPGGTPLAEVLRDAIKQHWQEQVTIETEVMLMYAARSQLLENVIKPALKQGQWVIGDRHDLSSRAYQGGGRGVNAELIESIRNITLKGFEPDLTLYLDVEPSVGLSRARGRGELDRIEVSGLAFFERVRKVYLEAADVDPKIKIINAMQPMDAVQQDALTVLKEFIQ